MTIIASGTLETEGTDNAVVVGSADRVVSFVASVV